MVQIRIENSEGELVKEVPVEVGKTLLSQLEAAEVEIPNACRAGMCAACMCHIKEWQEDIQKDLKWEPAFPLWEDEVMTCIAWVSDTDTTIVLQTMY